MLINDIGYILLLVYATSNMTHVMANVDSVRREIILIKHILFPFGHNYKTAKSRLFTTQRQGNSRSYQTYRI